MYNNIKYNFGDVPYRMYIKLLKLTNHKTAQVMVDKNTTNLQNTAVIHNI